MNKTIVYERASDPMTKEEIEMKQQIDTFYERKERQKTMQEKIKLALQSICLSLRMSKDAHVVSHEELELACRLALMKYYDLYDEPAVNDDGSERFDFDYTEKS